MRILHGMLEIAGQGSFSVKGLREIGQNVKMAAYNKNPGDYPCDFLLLNRNIKRIIDYPLLLLKLMLFFLYAIFRFNVFHFHFGYTLLPKNIDLVFLKLLRKKIFFEFHGSDLRTTYLAKKINPDIVLKNSSDIEKKTIKKNKKLLKFADGIILHDEELLPHLYLILKKDIPIHIIPLRMDLSLLTPVYPEENKEIVTIVHAPSHRGVKGTESVLDAIHSLKKKYKIEFILVENMTNVQALEIYKKADIVIDQLRSCSYGVLSIEAMALGKPVIISIIDDIMKTYPACLPVVNANVNTINSTLEKLIIDGKLRKELGRAGTKYVEKYHDCKKIAKILLKIYNNEHKSVFGPEAYEEVNE